MKSKRINGMRCHIISSSLKDFISSILFFLDFFRKKMFGNIGRLQQKTLAFVSNFIAQFDGNSYLSPVIIFLFNI